MWLWAPCEAISEIWTPCDISCGPSLSRLLGVPAAKTTTVTRQEILWFVTERLWNTVWKCGSAAKRHLRRLCVQRCWKSWPMTLGTEFSVPNRLLHWVCQWCGASWTMLPANGNCLRRTFGGRQVQLSCYMVWPFGSYSSRQWRISFYSLASWPGQGQGVCASKPWKICLLASFCSSHLPQSWHVTSTSIPISSSRFGRTFALQSFSASWCSMPSSTGACPWASRRFGESERKMRPASANMAGQKWPKISLVGLFHQVKAWRGVASTVCHKLEFPAASAKKCSVPGTLNIVNNSWFSRAPNVPESTSTQLDALDTWTLTPRIWRARDCCGGSLCRAIWPFSLRGTVPCREGKNRNGKIHGYL